MEEEKKKLNEMTEAEQNVAIAKGFGSAIGWCFQFAFEVLKMILVGSWELFKMIFLMMLHM